MGAQNAAAEEQSALDKGLDYLQGALDWVGLIPAVGDVCDLANACISLARGNYVDAALSLVSAIPGLGAIGPLAKAISKLPPWVLKQIKKFLGMLADLLKKVPLNKILDGASSILDDILKLIEKHVPGIGSKLRKLFCEKLGWTCFTAGTLVHTQVGLILIEAIREGDLVWSKNPETGETGLKNVESISRREVYITYEVSFGGQSITTTSEHPFWVYGKGFVNAEELSVGDEIVCDASENGNFHIEEITEIVKHLHEEKIAVYNFSVEDWHTYFVGEEKFWVHNAKCQVQINAENGRLFEQQEFAKFQNTANNTVEQITIKTNDGTKIRVDAIGKDANGDIIIQEYKSSSTATLTRNQTRGFPELSASGGTVVGAGKGEFTGGVTIPSGTNVTIIRP